MCPKQSHFNLSVMAGKENTAAGEENAACVAVKALYLRKKRKTGGKGDGEIPPYISLALSITLPAARAFVGAVLQPA
ncbi:hypothetical protein GCM10008941_35260 [Rhizomicrobium palustre]